MIYAEIGTNQQTIVPDNFLYTPGTNEILMSEERPLSTSVAKEDGTWVTPPSDYTVYTCVDGKLTIDVDATYANVEKAYESDSTNILLAASSALLAHKSGLITESAYDANVLALSADHISLFSTIVTAKEAAING